MVLAVITIRGHQRTVGVTDHGLPVPCIILILERAIACDVARPIVGRRGDASGRSDFVGTVHVAGLRSSIVVELVEIAQPIERPVLILAGGDAERIKAQRSSLGIGQAAEGVIAQVDPLFCDRIAVLDAVLTNRGDPEVSILAASPFQLLRLSRFLSFDLPLPHKVSLPVKHVRH